MNTFPTEGVISNPETSIETSHLAVTVPTEAVASTPLLVVNTFPTDAVAPTPVREKETSHLAVTVPERPIASRPF